MDFEFFLMEPLFCAFEGKRLFWARFLNKYLKIFIKKIFEKFLYDRIEKTSIYNKVFGWKFFSQNSKNFPKAYLHTMSANRRFRACMATYDVSAHFRRIERTMTWWIETHIRLIVQKVVCRTRCRRMTTNRIVDTTIRWTETKFCAYDVISYAAHDFSHDENWNAFSSYDLGYDVIIVS
jgi:hypothetical protein